MKKLITIMVLILLTFNVNAKVVNCIVMTPKNSNIKPSIVSCQEGEPCLDYKTFKVPSHTIPFYKTDLFYYITSILALCLFSIIAIKIKGGLSCSDRVIKN